MDESFVIKNILKKTKLSEKDTRVIEELTDNLGWNSFITLMKSGVYQTIVSRKLENKTIANLFKKWNKRLKSKVTIKNAKNIEEIELLKKKYKKKLDKFSPPEVRYCLEEEDQTETIEKTQYPKIMLIIRRLNGSILDDWLQDYFNQLPIN